MKCPICNSHKFKYEEHSESIGTVEQHGYCDTCGYIIEQAYSSVYYGFDFSRRKGYKLNGKWCGKNIRKRKRMKRKYHIKHTSEDWWLSRI